MKNFFNVIVLACLLNIQLIFPQTVNFFAKTDFPAGTGTAAVTIGDLNGDGKPDIVCPNAGTDASISVFMNTTTPLATTPSFSAKTDFLTGAAPVSAAIGDINGDGKPDVVVAVDGAHTVAVFLNTTTTGAITPTFSTRTDFAAIYSPYLVKLTDLNGDGKLDIVCADYYAKKVSVFINTTATGASIPTFGTRKDFPAGQYTSCIAVGDLNGDGKPDIAATNDGDNTVSVLINTTITGDTTATFSTTSNFPTGVKPYGVEVADLNGDGKPDIVTTNATDNTASVLLNTTTTGDTTATFSAKTDFPTGAYPVSVAIADFNNDGKLDIAAGDYSANTVSVLLNTTTTGASTASFADKTDFTTGANPRIVAIADLNGDGKPDIVTANYTGNSVSVLLYSSTPPPVSEFDNVAAMYLQNATVETVLSVANIDYNSKVSIAAKSEDYQNMWFVVMDDKSPVLLYRLKNLYSSKVMSDSADGSIIVKGEGNDDSQRWKLTDAGNKKWKFENVKSGKLLTLKNGIISLATADNTASQLWSIAMVNPDYAVPVPKPINIGNYLVAAEMCNLWDVTTRPYCWNNIAPYPDRKPVTGWFKEGSPEVMDWDIKMAVDNGISFFMPCWYRSEASVGKPEVKGVYDQWIDGLANAKYKDYTKFMLIWVNSSLAGLYGGISDKNDFINNLAPYFINHYFKNPNYLLIDGKPVISFFDPTAFINECGGMSNAADAIAQFRQMVKDAGFKDIILMGQWCSADYIAHNNYDWKAIGADYHNAYHYPTFVNGAIAGWPPSGYLPDDQVIADEKYCWDGQAKYSLLPSLITCTMGWDSRPWGGAAVGFRLSPGNFTNLLALAKTELDSRNQSNLESHLIVLDNWDEFGEGHYIYPTEQYGFGYLNSVRQTLENPTSIKNNTFVLPDEFSLSQNYPNPFNPNTEIKYSISKNSLVTLKVYNLLGQEVALLVNQQQTYGNYTVNFDASKLASGVYMYRIQAGDFSLTKKMIVLK